MSWAEGRVWPTQAMNFGVCSYEEVFQKRDSFCLHPLPGMSETLSVCMESRCISLIMVLFPGEILELLVIPAAGKDEGLWRTENNKTTTVFPVVIVRSCPALPFSMMAGLKQNSSVTEVTCVHVFLLHPWFSCEGMNWGHALTASHVAL